MQELIFCERASRGRIQKRLPTASQHHWALNCIPAFIVVFADSNQTNWNVAVEMRRGRMVDELSGVGLLIRFRLGAPCTAIVEILRKLRSIFAVRSSPAPSPAAATSARFEVRDYFHTSRRPTFLRPRTCALRLVAASPRCGIVYLASGRSRCP